MVDALPILAEVAIPSVSGRNSLGLRLCFTYMFKTSGAISRQAASFVIKAERAADRTHTLHRIFLNDSDLPNIFTDNMVNNPSLSKKYDRTIIPIKR